LWLPTEDSVRVALRTQQIIAHESGAADTIDPLAGSYLIEYLTDEIQRRAGVYIEQIDALGGALAAIDRGFVQNEIQSAAYDYQQDIENGDEILVGVNAFQVDEEIELEQLKVDLAVEAPQRARLEALRAGRDAGRVGELLGHLETNARTKENLMPVFIECVENGITLGEICGLLRGLWGEYEPPTGI
jgi:methylmalonyl-CoA mutase N-terminal domain/subunit